MLDFVSKFDSERLGIATHAKRSPDRAAFIMNDVIVTYRELDQQTNALANGLLKLGLSPGERLSILMPNSPEIMISWSAAGKIAATPIALNYRFKEDELAYIINDSESKFLIYGHEFQEVVEAAKARLSGPRLTYIRWAGPSAKGVMDFYGLIEKNPITPPQIEPGPLE